jgi:hypothetical protein
LEKRCAIANSSTDFRRQIRLAFLRLFLLVTITATTNVAFAFWDLVGAIVAPYIGDKLENLIKSRDGKSTAPLAQAPPQTDAVSVARAQRKLSVCEGRDVSQWTNCFGTYTRPSGAIYVGEFKNGKPDGQGSLTYPSALRSGAPPSKYVGEFKDGDFNGQGIH